LAVVVEPIEQRADRGILLILHHGGIIERSQQIAARMELAQQPLVIDIEAERLGGGVEVGAVNEQSDLFGWHGHGVFSSFLLVWIVGFTVIGNVQSGLANGSGNSRPMARKPGAME